jgi:chemotaxis response regulator CheB
MIRAVVASARTAIRDALKIVIESSTGIVVIGEAATGRELADLWDRFGPDMIFVDSSSEGFEGFKVLGRRRLGMVLISDEKNPSPCQEVAVATVDVNAHTFDLTNAILEIVASGNSGRSVLTTQ